MVRVPVVFISFLISLHFPLAASAEEVGNAQAVVASATASGEIGDRVLAAGSVIHLNDLLSTDGTGEVQLLFADDTRMVVGPNASLVIDQFVFRGDKAENSFAVRALGGAFRFIGGKEDDADYAIRTPSATIGVRGTAFDFTVTAQGTDLMLLEGVAALCGLDGQCAITGETCGILQAPAGQAAGIAPERDRVRLASRNFPFARAEERLLAGFQLEGNRCLGSRSSSRVFGRDVPAREIQEIVDPPDPPAPDPPAPEPPAPEPPALGNPGNPKPVGRAGRMPGGKNFGLIGRGRSDVAPGQVSGGLGGAAAGSGDAGGSASGASDAGAAGSDTGGASAGGRGKGPNGNNAGGQGKGRGGGIGGGRSAAAASEAGGPGRGQGGGSGGGAGSQR